MTENRGTLDVYQEIRMQRLMLLLVLALIIPSLLLANALGILFLPRIERIFEDLLGTRDKLPELTKLVLAYGRLGGGLFAQALVGTVGLSAFLMFVRNRRSYWVLALVGFALVFLIFHLLLIGFSMGMPLLQLTSVLQLSPP